ncbi:acyl carrier protein [Kitasatospora sp. A2-31]|uniref:acyl carrier protein n=1 Tax=Kitasatospora sp. A2-31 TaxID=2916414 RepID=UPI001EE9DDD8|nr:acyl carrier protein [Kitasatospora sp. A2-31]MCG6497861.1 acyl carrier protein [Kitasatospora sp. A2-31]
MPDPVVQTTETELRDRILHGLGELLPRVLKRDLPEIPADACLFDDLGLTSASTIELILEIEEALDIQVDVEQIGEDDLRSVTSLADYIAGHVIAED